MFGLFQKDTPRLDALSAEQSDECAALHAASFTYPWPQADFEDLLAARTTFAEGAYARGNELVGFILSRLAADEAEILTIAVKPRRRGQGIARRLMHASMARLQVAGAKSWFLEVESKNASALALYKRFGFEQVGERKSYYRTEGGEAALALILRRSLR